MEIEYAQKYAPLYKQRAQIVSGEIEPSASECLMPGEEIDNEKTDNEKQVLYNFTRTVFTQHDLQYSFIPILVRL